MNETKWALEYETLKLKEKRKADEFGEIYKAVRREIINLLGLNIMPLEDSETGLLRRPNENEYTPMVIFTAREGIVEAFIQKNDELRSQEEVEKELEEESVKESDKPLSPEELDDFFKDDIVFLDDPEELKKRAVRMSPETAWLNKNVIQVLEDEKEVKKSKEPMKISVQSEEVELAPVAKSKRKVFITTE
jgi:hypothetical protein